MMPRQRPVGVRKARSLLHEGPEGVARDTEVSGRRGFVEAKTEVDQVELPREVTQYGRRPQRKVVAATTEPHVFSLDDLLRSSVQPVTPPPIPVIESDAKKISLPPRPPVEKRPPAKEKSVVRRIMNSVVTVLKGGQKSQTPKPVSDDIWRELRTLPILDGLPNETLSAAVAAGELAIVRAQRDDLIDVEGRTLLVSTGQVALARFAAEILDEEKKAQGAKKPGDKKSEKKEAKRRQEAGPMIARAERNLAFFEEGDLVDLALGGPNVVTPYACYAVTPSTVVSVARGRLDEWKKSFAFLADRLRRASQAARQRVDAASGAREEVADFFIRHGFSVAQTLRVRQIDKCVECGECEKACETRYGAKRLSLHGHVLGGLDFVSACHTCSDQRCIDPCAFDAIKYDTERREVVIVEAACTGCTLCATACPYQAIEMHDLEEKPLLQIRLSKEGKLAFGEGTPRKAKLKRMASKCDHCVTYEDQACISACPTGALFEVAPADVFHARSFEVREAARGGFDHTAVHDVRALHDPKVFAHGIDQKTDRARRIRPQIWTTWMWVAGLGAWLLTVGEILLRKVAPAHSIDYLYQTLVDGIEPAIALARVDYRPGCELAVRLGYIGSIVMFSGMLYPARRRIARFKNWGSERAWFDMHVLSGVIGPLFVLLHTAVKLDNWVSLAFWSMVGTVLSGLAGRYLTTQLPARASSAALDILEVDQKLSALRARYALVRTVDDWYAVYQRQVAEVSKRSLLSVLRWLLVDDLRRPTRVRMLADKLFSIGDPRARTEAARYAARLALYERRRVLLPRLEPLFRRWKLVHVPMAIALTLIGGIHIALSLVNG
jgi:Fe-S-cluster-containing hydrogenase component 2